MESSDKINSIISAASNNQFRSKVKLKRNLVKRDPYQEISNSVQFAYTRKRNVWENERLQLPGNNSSIYHNKLCYVLGFQLLTFLRILIISIEQRENQFASTRKKRDFPRYFLLARFFAPRSFPLPLSSILARFSPSSLNARVANSGTPLPRPLHRVFRVCCSVN